MRNKLSLELAVGVFMIAGLLCLGYLSVNLGKVEIWKKPTNDLYAIFNDIGGLRVGSPVVISGVEVGSVKKISLVDYEARVEMQLSPEIKVHEDAVVSVKTRGLIGEKFIQISAGAADDVIASGGRIRQTESAVDLEALISKFAFGGL